MRFSKNRLSDRKNASVIAVTAATQGRNSRSRSHRRSMTVEAKADISSDQNNSEPSWPPHMAVTFKYKGISLLVTE